MASSRWTRSPAGRSPSSGRFAQWTGLGRPETFDSVEDLRVSVTHRRVGVVRGAVPAVAPAGARLPADARQTATPAAAHGGTPGPGVAGRRPTGQVAVRTKPPTLRLEKKLLREGHRVLAACDEVGRGALSGPATVGVVLIDETTTRPLTGLRDSKLLAPPARTALVPRIRRWVVGCAVGHASAAEVDEIGIIPALRLAAGRALGSLDVRPDVVLLDGTYDYLTPPAQRGLFGTESLFPDLDLPRVVTQVKGDMSCSSVAAASILAKCERDAIMVELARSHPAYSWEINKGYATPEHMEAIRRHGPTDQHRCSWRLPRQLVAMASKRRGRLSEVGGEWLSTRGARAGQALVGDNGPAELAA